MILYAWRRILSGIPVLFVLTALSFFLMRVAPGGPFSGDRRIKPEVIANLNRVYHLDEPILQQFARYLWNILHFDFGPSMAYKDYSVADLILRGFPISLEVGIYAMLLSTAVGILLGLIGAVRRNGIADYGAGTLGVIGIAIPIFVVGPLLQLILALQLGLLPVAGWTGSWRDKVLPVLVLALPNIAYVSRIARASMIETLRAHYVRTARAKGIGKRRTLLNHALRGAILPVISYLGPSTASLITGSIVIEQIFAIPGIGRYFVEAANNRDYTLVMGVTLFYGALIILCNLLADLGRSLLDPKVRHE